MISNSNNNEKRPYNDIRKCRADQLVKRFKGEASVYHDETKASQLDKLYYVPQLRISSLVDTCLQEIDYKQVIHSYDPMRCTFPIFGQIAKADISTSRGLIDICNRSPVETGIYERQFTQIKSEKLISDIYLNSENNLVAQTEDMVNQSVIAAGNKLFIKGLNESAIASSNCMQISEFNKQVFADALASITNKGKHPSQVICSADVFAKISCWEGLSQITTTALESNLGNLDFDSIKNTGISWLSRVNLGNANWISVPANDAYNVIEPNTMYITSSPDELGRFCRRIDRTTRQAPVNDPNGLRIVMSESLCIAIMNPECVIKLQLL